MDKKVLVEKLKKLIVSFEDDNKPFSVVLLIANTPGSIETDYKLIISAPWMDDLSSYDAIGLIIDKIIAQENSTNSILYKKLIPILPIRSTDSSILKVISDFDVGVNDKTILLTNYPFSNIVIEDGIVVVAQNIKSKKPTFTKQIDYHTQYYTNSTLN